MSFIYVPKPYFAALILAMSLKFSDYTLHVLLERTVACSCMCMWRRNLFLINCTYVFVADNKYKLSKYLLLSKNGRLDVDEVGTVLVLDRLKGQ
jgi:hypothetical protein